MPAPFRLSGRSEQLQSEVLLQNHDASEQESDYSVKRNMNSLPEPPILVTCAICGVETKPVRLHPCEHAEFYARCIVWITNGQCPLCRAAISTVDLSDTVSRYIRDIEIVSQMVDHNDKTNALQVLLLGTAQSQKMELVRSIVSEEVRRNPNHGKEGLFQRPFFTNATLRGHDICLKVFPTSNTPVPETVQDDLRNHNTDLVIVCAHRSETDIEDIFGRWNETIEVARPGVTVYFVTENIGADVVPEPTDMKEGSLPTRRLLLNQEYPLLVMKEDPDRVELRTVSHDIALAASEGRRRVRLRDFPRPVPVRDTN